jgi:polyamine oxidase
MRVLLSILLLIVIESKIENDYYDVVIIGCGSSGIGAAVELISQSNLTFIILEARNRVGGRAFTNKYSLDFPFDVGAEWMHGYNPNKSIYALHEQLKTELDEDYNIHLFDPTKIGCYDSDGSIVSQQICAQAQETINRLFSQITINNNDTDVSINDVIREEFNRLEEGHLKRLVKAILVAVEELFAADLDQLSAKQYLNEPNWSIEAGSKNNLVVKRGYGFFLERITDHYQLPIALNTAVAEIDTLSHSDIIQISTSQSRKISAKYVIITVPLGCLKQRTINFQPSLPQWKLDAIDQLGFGNTDKIIIQFDKIFWNETWTIIYLADARYPFAVCSPDKRTLSFMIGGRSAQAMEDEKDEIIISQIMDSLKRTFYQQQFKLEYYIISRWTRDEFSRGSYAYFKPNSSLETMKLLEKECAANRLFWAGEHTSDGASVHTAFATGQREAKKILNHHSIKTNIS